MPAAQNNASPADISQSIRDADEYRDFDRARRDLIDLKSRADIIAGKLRAILAEIEKDRRGYEALHQKYRIGSWGSMAEDCRRRGVATKELISAIEIAIQSVDPARIRFAIAPEQIMDLSVQHRHPADSVSKGKSFFDRVLKCSSYLIPVFLLSIPLSLWIGQRKYIEIVGGCGAYLAVLLCIDALRALPLRWRSRRRWQAVIDGVCADCGYDLRKSHDRCPECNAPIPWDLPQTDGPLNTLKEAKNSDDGDRIKKAIENLNNVSHKLAEEMYKGAGATADAAGGSMPPPSDRATHAGEKKKDEDVIDAEYEVKE